MCRRNGFTILEMMIAIAVIGVVSTLALTGYQTYMQKANFRALVEEASRFSLDQQEHRQEHGRFASGIKQNGGPSADQMVFQPRDDFSVDITQADFREFSATFGVRDANMLPDQCQQLLIMNSQGFLRMESRDADQQDSSASCLPRGYR